MESPISQFDDYPPNGGYAVSQIRDIVFPDATPEHVAMTIRPCRHLDYAQNQATPPTNHQLEPK